MGAKNLKRGKVTAIGRATAVRPSRAYNEGVIAGLICIFLGAIIWIAFGGALGNGFVSYDDGDYVYENPKVIAGLNLSGIKWAFTHVHSANWHPLTTISHMLDCQLYGLQPWGHHLTNVLLHALAAILLFFALKALTAGQSSGIGAALYERRPAESKVSPPVIDRRYNFWACAFVAALFAIHPLRVESVAWISERKDVLSGVFFMLTLLAYARYARSERRPLGKYITVVVLFALGLMCKPTLVTLPFILLLLDYWPLRRMQSAKGQGQRSQMSVVRGQWSVVPLQWSVVCSLFLEKIHLFVLSAVSCVATVVAEKKALDTDLKLNFLQRAANAAVSYVTYLGQMIWPIHLTVMYPYHGLKIGEVILALLLLIAISVIFLACRRKYPFLVVGWLWYLGMLVPMIGLVQVGLQPRADRYTYLSQIGLYLLVTWGMVVLFTRWHWKPAIWAILGLLIVAALTMGSRAQTLYWRTSETLWEHAIEITSDNYVAYDNLGTVLLRKRQPAAAMAEFQKAIQIKPDFENACASAGSASMLMGQVSQAIDYYQRALQLRPESAEDWSNLATALLQKGEIDQAIEHYKKAVALKPESAELQYNLGRAFANNHNWMDAISCYQAAIERQPGEAKFYNNLGVALAEIGKTSEALEQVRKALMINPSSAEAHYNLGSLLAHQGDVENGTVHLREALRLKPNYEEAKKRLSELGIPPSS